MVNWKGKKTGDILWFANAVVAIVLVNLLGAASFFRIDLTEEHRYSIKEQTRAILSALEDDVHIEVFLEGDLNADFKRFQKSIVETLDEFRVYAGNKIHYRLTDPALATGQKAQSEFMADLSARGIQPMNVIDSRNGQRIEKIIFPGAIVSYGGLETGVMLLKGNTAAKINQSIEGIEFELASAVFRLSNTERKRIGFVTGHGELDSLEIASFNNDLLETYDVFKVDLGKRSSISHYDALVIAKPVRSFPAADKYKLDQFIMNGGSVLFLLDRLDAVMDSASREDYFAIPYDLDLDDQLFRYGVRINPELVQDQHAAMVTVVTGQTGGRPKFDLMEWPFFPLINHYAEHPITRNLDAVALRFVNSIDTVKADGIQKTPLLFTSVASRRLRAPVKVSVDDLRKTSNSEAFGDEVVPLGYLLEGKFTSLYKNRFPPEGVSQENFREEGVPAKVLVIADGDVIRNDINARSGQPRPLGFDPVSNYTFANRDLLLNALAYLTDEQGLIQSRTKEVKIRPLNREKIRDEKLKWQIVNLALPLVLLVAYGAARAYWRKKKFASF
jgi:gliding-associated putative ABC transporter substrate-binding component GldG